MIRYKIVPNAKVIGNPRPGYSSLSVCLSVCLSVILNLLTGCHSTAFTVYSMDSLHITSYTEWQILMLKLRCRIKVSKAKKLELAVGCTWLVSYTRPLFEAVINPRRVGGHGF